MKNSSSLQWRTHAGLSLIALAAFICAASMTRVAGADTKTSNSKSPTATTASTNAPAVKATTKKKPATKLDGAQLYAINCNRCHAERYPTEFNSAQWKTLMTHMRVRANLPAVQAKAILKYLQEESGN